MPLSDPDQPQHVSGGVVVAVDPLGCDLVHHELAAESGDQAGGHPHMVGMEMRDDQRMDAALVQTELLQTFSERLSPRLPVGAAVDE